MQNYFLKNQWKTCIYIADKCSEQKTRTDCYSMESFTVVKYHIAGLEQETITGIDRMIKYGSKNPKQVCMSLTV